MQVVGAGFHGLSTRESQSLGVIVAAKLRDMTFGRGALRSAAQTELRRLASGPDEADDL